MITIKSKVGKKELNDRNHSYGVYNFLMEFFGDEEEEIIEAQSWVDNCIECGMDDDEETFESESGNWSVTVSIN